jgi:hypothetical protein
MAEASAGKGLESMKLQGKYSSLRCVSHLGPRERTTDKVPILLLECASSGSGLSSRRYRPLFLANHPSNLGLIVVDLSRIEQHLKVLAEHWWLKCRELGA